MTSRHSIGLLLVVYAAFVALGLPDTVLGAAWPVMHGEFGVSLGSLGVIGVTSALAAVASSVAYGWIPRKPAPWVMLLGSVGLMVLTLLAFGVVDRWWMVVALSAAWGLCGGGIDIELNHFAARQLSGRHMSWLHGCWGLGATAGPLLMAVMLSATGQWRSGFWLLAAIMGLLCLGVWITRHLWPPAQAVAPAQVVDTSADEPAPSPWAVWLSPICFFLIVAAEFATAIWIPSIMTDLHALPPAQASQWATLFFGAMMAGRFALGAFGEGLGNRRMVRLGIAAAIAGAGIFVACGATPVGAAGLGLMGLGAAPLFPAQMHETTKRFSAAWSARMVARQMTGAYLAGAVMPLVYAAVVDRIGTHAIIPTAMGLLALLAVSSAALNRVTPEQRPHHG